MEYFPDLKIFKLRHSDAIIYTSHTFPAPTGPIIATGSYGCIKYYRFECLISDQ